jgi:hypothetical protein
VDEEEDGDGVAVAIGEDEVMKDEGGCAQRSEEPQMNKKRKKEEDEGRRRQKLRRGAGSRTEEDGEAATAGPSERESEGATAEPMEEEQDVDDLSARAVQGSVVEAVAETRPPGTTPTPLKQGLLQRTLTLSGGRTTAARRRQRRTEGELARAHGLLAKEVRERRADRAKVLRASVRRLIAELREPVSSLPLNKRRQVIRGAVSGMQTAVARAAAEHRLLTREAARGAASAATAPTLEQLKAMTYDEWLQYRQQYSQRLPMYLDDEGSLAEMRSARRAAMKAAKKFRVLRRSRRLYQNRLEQERLEREGPTHRAAERRRRKKRGYQYVQQGKYGDVELVQDDAGKELRMAPLRVVGAGQVNSLPTALLALTKTYTLEARLDTCAQFSVAGVELRKYGRCIARAAPVDVVEGFGGGRIKVLGVWQFVGTTRYQQRIKVNALLVDGQGSEFLIGEDWMIEQQAKMDFAKRELKYRDSGGQKVILPFTCSSVSTPSTLAGERQIAVRLAKTVKLANNTNRVLRLTVDAEEGTTGIFLPKPNSKRHLLMAPTLSTVRDGLVSVAVLNVDGKREKLPAREALGTWVPTDATMELLSMNGELERARVKEWVTKLRKEDAPPLVDEGKLNIGEMDSADKDLVIAVLRQYAEIVNKKPGCPPLANTQVQHHINTGDAAPIMLRRHRHTVSENLVTDKNVDEMLEHGVIEEGQGAWGFPVVLVKKKDGSVRFCVDYRALNAVTVKDVYPLPRIDETLEALCGARRFTSLDLHAGYWQLAVAPEDRVKTAFTTRRGLFQFRRMPFGLCNAPGTFQRLMDCVLRGITWISCLGYLDDVVIFTKGSVARHVVELAAVLERLAGAGLSLKSSKCSFATTKMEYLGHDLTPDGIQPTDRLVTAVKEFPVPTNEAEVKQFVALAGYYRRCMPGFGTKLAPLTRLLRKSADWEWGEAQDAAFSWAKTQLSKKPVLIYPNYNLPFKLTTDASKVGLGAVLSQDHGEGDQPVAFASKVNSPTVANYNISELECLAVVWAVRLFRPHLYGRKFTIATDHIALKWLMTATAPAGRLHRWALTLQEYDFVIEYRPGRENHVADALSRNPGVAKEELPADDAAREELDIGRPAREEVEKQVEAALIRLMSGPGGPVRPEAGDQELDDVARAGIPTSAALLSSPLSLANLNPFLIPLQMELQILAPCMPPPFMCLNGYPISLCVIVSLVPLFALRALIALA